MAFFVRFGLLLGIVDSSKPQNLRSTHLEHKNDRSSGASGASGANCTFIYSSFASKRRVAAQGFLGAKNGLALHRWFSSHSNPTQDVSFMKLCINCRSFSTTTCLRDAETPTSSGGGKTPSSSDKTPSSSSSDKTPSSSSSDKTPSNSNETPSNSNETPSNSNETPSNSNETPLNSDKAICNSNCTLSSRDHESDYESDANVSESNFDEFDLEGSQSVDHRKIIQKDLRNIERAREGDSTAKTILENKYPNFLGKSIRDDKGNLKSTEAKLNDLEESTKREYEFE